MEKATNPQNDWMTLIECGRHPISYYTKHKIFGIEQ